MRTANFGGRDVKIVVGYQRLGELSEKLKPFSDRVLKDQKYFDFLFPVKKLLMY